MKKALMIAMDAYAGYPSFRGSVQGDALRLRELIGDPRFGQFTPSLLENDTHGSFFSRSARFFAEAAEADELLFYFSGHGDIGQLGELMLLPVDARPDDLARTSLSATALVGMIAASRARTVSVILDCCHSTLFLDAMAKAWAAGGEGGRSFPGKTVAALCSGEESFAVGGRSPFTSAIINALCGGVVPKPRITLRDLAEHLLITLDVVHDMTRHYALYRAAGADGAESGPIVSVNLMRGEPLPPHILPDLYSDDQDRVFKAVRQLIIIDETASNGADARSRAAFILHFFAEHRGSQNAAVAAVLKGYRQAREAPADSTDIRIFFHTRNQPFADAAKLFFQTHNIAASFCDLDYLQFALQKEVLDWIVGDLPSLWIADTDFIQSMVGRSPEIHECLCQTPPSTTHNRAVYRIDTGGSLLGTDPLARARFLGDGTQPIEAVAAALARALFPDRTEIEAGASGFSPRSNPSVVKAGERFLSVVEANELRLKGRQRHIDYMPPYVLEAAPREPKFLIYERSGEFVMAVADTLASIDDHALQLTFEPHHKARLATPEELAALGFADRRVDPMWYDPGRRISRIFVDANLFFQFLMFPFTKVMLPKYHAGADEKVFAYMSSFVRALLQFHGERKIVFANIIREKQFSDRLLVSLLSQHYAFSRFAPTPSNSLHVGSIRTALISYLFTASDAERGRFHIRFDDTNVPPAVADQNIEQILEDLKWIGIPATTVHYRQTQDSAREQYETAFSLFQEAGLMTKRSDGSFQLNPDPHITNCSYWLDLRRGPRVMHEAPRLSSNDKPLDYSVTWPPDSDDVAHRYKYKFAGAIDDMMHNSIVVRDVRQEDSAFTARQSLIMGMVRETLAFARNSASRKYEKDLRKLQKRRIANNSNFKPFPFPCPPVYFHVSRVSDPKGEQLSKRLLKPEHSIAFLRNSGGYFPETILIWCLASLGRGFVAKLGFTSLAQLTAAVAEIGVNAFLTAMKGRVTPAALWQSDQTHTIRIRGLPRIDYAVLNGVPPYRLRTFANDLYARNGQTPPADIGDVARRLLSARTRVTRKGRTVSYLVSRNFAGAAELARLFRVLDQAPEGPPPDSVFEPPVLDVPKVDGVEAWLAARRPEEMRWIRFCVFGVPDGPPLSDLLHVMGAARFVTALRRRIND